MGPSEDLNIGIGMWRPLSLKGRGLSVGTEGLVRKGCSPGKCGKADLDVFLNLLIVSSQRPVSRGHEVPEQTPSETRDSSLSGNSPQTQRQVPQ